MHLGVYDIRYLGIYVCYLSCDSFELTNSVLPDQTYGSLAKGLPVDWSYITDIRVRMIYSCVLWEAYRHLYIVSTYRARRC